MKSDSLIQKAKANKIGKLKPEIKHNSGKLTVIFDGIVSVSFVPASTKQAVGKIQIILGGRHEDGTVTPEVYDPVDFD